MATKIDKTAAKQRQQKIILAVGAVLLVGILAFQAPKLMKHSKSSSSATSTTSTSSTSTASSTDTSTASSTDTSTTGTTSPTSASLPAGSTRGAAQLAGVLLPRTATPSASVGQLWSLSRFKVKDPFVQQVSDASAAAAGVGSGSSSGTTTGSGNGGTGSTGSTGGGVIQRTPPAVFLYATLMVNGKAQQVTLLDPFAGTTFRVVAVGKGFIKFKVVGGSFVGGTSVKLELGKPVTVMNTATGQRFVIKLVYTGTQPEKIATYKPNTSTSTPASSSASNQSATSTSAP